MAEHKNYLDAFNEAGKISAELDKALDDATVEFVKDKVEGPTDLDYVMIRTALSTGANVAMKILVEHTMKKEGLHYDRKN